MGNFIGREGELAVLKEQALEAGAGEFRLVQVEGEPGIGKSRLLEELASFADSEGWLVLRGSAAEFESELPFGPVIDALDAHLMSIDPSSIGRLGPETAEMLAEVFPSLVSYRSDIRGPVIASERFRIHHAIRELLERLSGRAPMLLILDDLHWADQASLELVAHLLRRPPQAGILLAFANRSGQLDPGLSSTLTAAKPARALNVGPLDLEEASELSQEDKASVELLYRETGGNPFYILEMIRAGINSGDGRALPDTVASAISVETSSLELGSRRFAEAAAVVGDPFDIDLVSRVIGSEASPIHSIDELTRRGLVKPTEVPRRFSFRHPLVRSAIYESTLPGTRLSDHEHAALSLAERDAPASEQSRHLVLSARPGDDKAARVIAAGAADTLASAPMLSIDWCDTALRLMSNSETEFRLQILQVKAAASSAMGNFEGSLEALLEALSLVSSDRLEERITLTAAAASTEELLGHHLAARERLTTLLAELEDQGSIQAIEVMTSLANDAFLRNDFDEMSKWSIRALEAAVAKKDVEHIAVAHATRALCASFTGPIQEARECGDAATDAYATFDSNQLDRNVDGLVRLTAAELYLERFENVLLHGKQARDSSRRIGQGQNFPILYPSIGGAGTTLGEFDVAREALDSAIDGARISNNLHSLAWSLLNRANLALSEGDIELADQLSAESEGLLGTHEAGLIKVWSGLVRAATLEALGRHDEALECFSTSAGGEGLDAVPGSWRVGYLLVEVEALLALGRIDDAARVCSIAEARAEEFDNGMARSQAFRAKSIVALAGGDPAMATDFARQALTLSKEVGAVIEAGTARISLAQALKASGKDDEAITELEKALELFVEKGAKRLQKKVEQMLRAMGQTIYRRTAAGSAQSGVESLTQREREVAELVVDRRTNREIAETMFLSHKTVEAHLRNIFSKLNVSSRVEVARTLEGKNLNSD